MRWIFGMIPSYPSQQMEVRERIARSRRLSAQIDTLCIFNEKTPPKSGVSSSRFVSSHFLGRDSQTVINLVQSSQIKIACRSTYIHSAMLTVDLSQHSTVFLFPMTKRWHQPAIHPGSPIYLFPTHLERENRQILDYRSCEHAIED